MLAGDVWLLLPKSSDPVNDIDVRLIRPNGTQAAFSQWSGSVFEKVRVTSGLVTGNWKIRITGFSVTGTQNVFWSVNKWPNQ